MLDVAHLELPPTATAADVDYVISSKMLGKASIIRPYQRPASVGEIGPGRTCAAASLQCYPGASADAAALWRIK